MTKELDITTINILAAEPTKKKILENGYLFRNYTGIKLTKTNKT